MEPDDEGQPERTESPEEAERAYVAGLIARGEAAPLDEQGRLPAGATHELVEGDDGRLSARRKRFSAF